MGLRGRLKRLEREAYKEMVEIPQRDGTVKRFPRGALMDAFLYLLDVECGNALPTEEPPIFGALRNAREPAEKWMGSFYFDPAEAPAVEPVPDLSEPPYGEKPL